LILDVLEELRIMAGDKQQRTVIITGAHGSLGAAVARAFASAGARVALLDHSPHPPAGLLDACGASPVSIGGVNLSDAAAATAAIDLAQSQLGGLDVLVNVAGAFRWQTIAEGDSATWDLLFAVNVKTALNSCRAALPYLRHSSAGRIVNIGANAALKAAAGLGAYTASKAGVHRLTESLAEELKKDGITVNAVLPSIIDTPANRADMPQADFSTWVTAEALAAVIQFLASAQAQAITGVLLPVTGRV
jgi:NAD(P)-dependent dehydrogenase (short-subunit alcohol dehydrogenase family)